MSEQLPRTPTLAQVMREAVEYRLRDLNTAMPAKITMYDSSKQTVDVQPLINSLQLTSEGEDLEETLPVMPDVPVMFPRNGEYFMTFPLKVGDVVLLIFNQRSIDKYTANTSGDPVNPEDFRLHDLSDAIALPGFFPFGESIKDIDTSRMALGKDKGGMQIHIDGSSVEIDNGGGTTVKFDGASVGATMTLGTGAVSAAIYEELQLWWDAQMTPLLTAFGNHIHNIITPLPGMPTTTPIPLLVPLPFPPTAKSTKVKMPLG
jgi:hypothetical protein